MLHRLPTPSIGLTTLQGLTRERLTPNQLGRSPPAMTESRVLPA
jgi:hypothetical protein